MRVYLIIFVSFLSVQSFSQNRNSVWCFGDSAGITFNGSSTSLFISQVKSRGSCASIGDSLGALIFYGYTRATVIGNTARLINKSHALMQNGDNIVGEGWYQELLIIPNPFLDSQFYLFSIGVTGSSQLGLYYSKIDMSQDRGRGAVIQKNIQLNNFKATDGIIAIKHGNGRDWWIIERTWDTSNNKFYEYLVTPTGLNSPILLNRGAVYAGGFYFQEFSPTGNKFVGFSEAGLLELFDFDRCTGDITLNQRLCLESGAAPYPYWMGAAFSPDEHYLYMSQLGFQHSTYLIQYDLTAPVIAVSADTIWTYDSTEQAGGKLKLAPDGKIYMACAYYDGVNFNYPYPDTTFNFVNNNLSVINYPDSPGVSCGFAPFSFNLGVGRCYWGLPNNPDYELGAVINSMCDTVTGIEKIKYDVSGGELKVFYHPGWQIAFINAMNLKGKNCLLTIFDLTGRMVYKEEKNLDSGFFTKDLNCDALANGMYIVTLQTEKEKLLQRFIKE